MTVTFELDPGFVLAEQIPLGADDLRFGLEHYYVKPQAVIDIAVGLLRRGTPDPVVQELAALLHDEVDRVSELLAFEQPAGTEEQQGPARNWLYLQLKAAYDERALLRDPLAVVEQLHADFGYPPSISAFVRTVPMQPGDETGEADLMQRWAEFLQDEHRALTSQVDPA